MSYTAIMNVVDNRVTKYATFATQAEAATHIIVHPEYVNAFVVETLNAGVREWWVIGQNVTIVPVPPTVEELEQTANATQKAAILADSFVPQFIQMSPQEVTDYINTNVTNIATAKTVINKMALMLLLLARREFK